MSKQRAWFPAGLFAILEPQSFGALPVNEDEFTAVLANQQGLDAIADHIEALSRELEIPLTIMGGIIHPERQTLGLLIQCDPVIRQNIPAHREFTRRLCQTYHCENAGVAVKDDVVWLWKIDFARVLDLSGVNHDRAE